MKTIKHNGYLAFIDVKFAEHLEKRISVVCSGLMVLIDKSSGLEKEKLIRRFRRMMNLEVRIATATLDYLE